MQINIYIINIKYDTSNRIQNTYSIVHEANIYFPLSNWKMPALHYIREGN